MNIHSDAIPFNWNLKKLDTEIYIPIDNYHGEVSSEETKKGYYSGSYAFDGNHKTLWHSAYAGDDKKYVIFEFNEPSFISRLEYIPRNDSSGNGRILAGDIYVSDDKVHWKKVSTFTWANNSNFKSVEFRHYQKVKYLKLQATKTQNDQNNNVDKISAYGFNLYKPNFNYYPLTNNDIKITTNSQETKQSDCKIENALDNNTKTIWHSKWDKSTPANKVVVDFEFKNEKALTSFSYTPRQDNEVNGIITKAILYKVVEGKPLEKVADLNWANDRSIKTYFFTNDFKAQHLKLIIVQANNNFASAAEFAFSKRMKNY